MPPIAIPSTGLRLPTFWERVKDLAPEAFGADYPDPFLLQLASLRDEEMLAEPTPAGRDAGPTIAASGSGLKGIPLLPWEQTRVVSLCKRIDAFPEQITIGRSAENDVVVGSGLVSKRHAWLQHKGTDWLLTDIGSRNGTMVAGTAIPHGQPTPLEFGSEVGFGDTRWLFVLSAFFHHAVKTLLPKEAE